MKAGPAAEAPIEELKALAHPLRFQILELLRSGELNVGEIEAASGIGQPSLSQQLSVLRKAGLVKTRKEAKLVFYRRSEAALSHIADVVGSKPAQDKARKIGTLAAVPGAANFARMS